MNTSSPEIILIENQIQTTKDELHNLHTKLKALLDKRDKADEDRGSDFRTYLARACHMKGFSVQNVPNDVLGLAVRLYEENKEPVVPRWPAVPCAAPPEPIPEPHGHPPQEPPELEAVT